jgi:hypothetical protein
MSVLRHSFLNDFANTQAIHPLATFSRASSAWSPNYSNIWVETPANIPRFGFNPDTGECLGLLIEGARSNGLINSRTPFLTGWSLGGIATAVTSAGPDGAVDSATTITETLVLERHDGTVASGGTYSVSNTISALVRPGTATRVQLSGSGAGWPANPFANFDLTGAGSVTLVGAGVTRAAIRKVGDWYWCEISLTALASGTLNARVHMINSASAGFAPSYTGTGLTLHVSWVWCEPNATFASTPILPPIGAPGASSRAADLYSLPVSAIGAPASFPATLIAEGTFGLGGNLQTLIQADDGSASNRFALRREASATALSVLRVNATVVDSTTVAALAVNGQSMRAAMTLDGAGAARGSMGGAAAVGVAGGVSTGITTVRVGNSTAASESIFGHVARIAAIPRGTTDPTLQLLSA